MSERAVHPDVRVGLGSLLTFAAVVLGLLLRYHFLGVALLLAGVALLASGWTGTSLRVLFAAVGDRMGQERSEE